MARLTRFPPEFEALLSARGRRVRCTRGVTEQLLVYERDGHLCAQRPGARRWLVLGTFFEAT